MRLFAALALCLLAACPAPQTEPPPDAGSDDAGLPDAGLPDAGSPADAGVTAPATAAGRQLTWLLGLLNGGIDTATDAELSDHFTAAFLAAVPVDTLRAVLQQEAASGPYTLVGFVGTPSASSLEALVADAKGRLSRVTVVTKPTDGGKMSGLLFQSAADLDPALHTWAQVEPALRAVAPRVAYLEADIGAGTCAPLHAIDAGTSLALGSAFKLYVLDTLVNQIDAGTRAWTDQVAIRDDWKSLPSGKMQTAPVGTLYSLKTYAEQMISISDNTAADHLLLTLGRDAVEAQVAAAGHHAPPQNQPFLTTRELFTLKLMLSSAEQASWVSATVADKRTLLTTYAARDPRRFTGAWGAPRHVTDMEWFATPDDLCRVMVDLKAYGARPGTAEVLTALSINPGVADPAGQFSYVGFKGGSEPGVVTLTWLVQRASDGGWRVVSVLFNDPSAPVDEAQALYVAIAARALAGR